MAMYIHQYATHSKEQLDALRTRIDALLALPKKELTKQIPVLRPLMTEYSQLIRATMDLTAFHVILVSTSAGKDSQVMLDVVVQMALEQGVADRIRPVHCDLGRVEWEGTRELATLQCKRYGLGLDVVSRPQGDLLHQVEHQRKMWPSPVNRYCTSDQKRDQVEKVVTKRVNEYIDTHWMPKHATVKVLSCMGLRAQESTARSKRVPWGLNKRVTNGKRDVYDWLPIHDWTEDQVWALIHGKKLPYHKAYDLGMPRLSCVFCIYAPTEALLLAGYHNREKLAEYVRIEQATGHAFQYDSTTKQAMPLVRIQEKLEAGYIPQGKIDGSKWLECA